jgi:hypothetical protein
VQFLRHAGLPTMFFLRSARSMDGLTLDRLHALALHTFRCAHKTSSAQISLLHLISIFGTHPSLRQYLQARAFVSLLGRTGASIAADRSLEIQNDLQKERNTGHNVLNALHFSSLLQPLSWVTRMYRAALDVGGISDEGFKVSMKQEVEALRAMFFQALGSDLKTRTNSNPFWHTGQPRRMRDPGSMKDCRPWDWIWAVAAGRSAGLGTSRHETFWQYCVRHIRDHMFPY